MERNHAQKAQEYKDECLKKLKIKLHFSYNWPERNKKKTNIFESDHGHHARAPSLLLAELGRREGLLPHKTFLCEGVLCVQVSMCGHGREQFSSFQHSRANSPPTPRTLDEHIIQIRQWLKSVNFIYSGIPQAPRDTSL